MEITIGFSPCPNDTFIFEALVNGLINTGPIRFIPVLEDVETLNEWALEGRLSVTKLSYGVLPMVTDKYQVLDTGSALGTGVGPLLITHDPALSNRVEEQAVAIPGEHTTAHLLFSMAYPKATHKIFLRYDQIENFVAAGKGLGVIIHENRFTYSSKGLHKITDLGDYWERSTGEPIPLGGIVASRSLAPALQQQINQLIGDSIRHARKLYPQLSNYVKHHAQEMNEEVMRQHIDLYVNDYSLGLGRRGQMAIKRLLEVAGRLHPEWPKPPADLFV